MTIGAHSFGAGYMTRSIRPFKGSEDLHAILRFLRKCREIEPAGDYEHVGDLLWSMRNPSFDAKENICILSEGRRMVGYCIIDGSSFRFGTAPGADSSSDRALLHWAMVKSGASRSIHKIISTQVLETNSERMRLLAEKGFDQNVSYFTKMERNTGTGVEGRSLPDGFSFIDGPDSNMVDEYVRMHKAAWGKGSTYTAEVHAHVTRLPGYRRELNPTIITNDGRVAGSCICWIDRLNRLGEIEPLQVDPDFRRLGLAKSLVVEALRRMKRFGMDSALVYNASVNEAAGRLYATAGFRPNGRVLLYDRLTSDSRAF